MSIIKRYIMERGNKNQFLRNHGALLLIAVFALIIGGSDCSKMEKDCHKEITIINNTDQVLYFYYSDKYPDTSIIDYDPSVASDFYKIKSHSSKIHYDRDGCFDMYLKKENKLMYFLFDSLVLSSIPWDSIRENYLFVKRYDLNLEDFEKNNWTITYP